MIFSVQGFLQDHFNKRNLTDADQYAVTIANILASRAPANEKLLLRQIRKIKTSFFRINPALDRNAFEEKLAKTLHKKFRKQKAAADVNFLRSAIKAEKSRVSKGERRSVGEMLVRFGQSIEARGVDVLWESRAAQKLRKRPENIAQSILATYFLGSTDRSGGNVFRELSSGTGFVDVVIQLSRANHLVEIKVLKTKFTGPEQLVDYMKKEGRAQGWLVIFDARPESAQKGVPTQIRTQGRTVKVIHININPVAASRRKTFATH
jgi:hypothetical protein